MEREGKGEGRRGGEMRKGRRGRGIIVGGITLLLLFGCNNGGELEAQKRLGEIGRSAENAFYEFIGLIADSLGFRVTAKTTKQQVGEHFADLGKQLGMASDKLEEVAKKAETGDDKSDSSKNLIREAVDTAKTTLKELKGYLDNLGTVGGDGKVVGETENNSTQGKEAEAGEITKTVEALQGIVRIAKDSKVIQGELAKSSITISTAGIGGSTPEHGAKLLATDSAPTAGDEAKAAAIVSKVSGEEILEAIIASDEKTDLSSANATAKTSALAFAKGGQSARVAQNAAKVSAVAGGIALLSLIKGGTLGAGATGRETVQSVGITAANKLIVQVEDIIKKTVKNVIDKAKEKIDEARNPKAIR